MFFFEPYTVCSSDFGANCRDNSRGAKRQWSSLHLLMKSMRLSHRTTSWQSVVMAKDGQSDSFLELSCGALQQPFGNHALQAHGNRGGGANICYNKRGIVNFQSLPHNSRSPLHVHNGSGDSVI